MTKINYDEYFDSKENKYYDPEVMMSLLEKLSGRNFEDIILFLTESKITVTDGEIEAYLDERFSEDDPELKARIEARKSSYEPSISSREYVEWNTEKFMDNLAAKKYAYNPAVLTYYRHYSRVCASKAEAMLTIIENICNKTTGKIQDILDELKIRLDERGNILKDDIIHLVKPVLFNINEFEKTVEDANNLNTYLEKKFSEEELIDGMIRCEEKEIQKKSLDNCFYEGNIPLTKEQEDEILVRESKMMVKILNMVQE